MEKNFFLMLGFIKDICENIGTRFGCSKGEYEAGLKIKGIMEPIVDEVALEDFRCHPKAFLDFARVAFFTSLISTALFVLFPVISFILYLYTITVFVFEQSLLKEYVDFFFPTEQGTNIIGKLKPRSEVKQIVLFSGHHDAAYEFPLFEKYKSKFGILAYSTVGTVILSAIVALILFILSLFNITLLFLTLGLFSVPVVSIIMVGYLAFNLHSKNIIPGANDNLSGVAVVLALAYYFNKNRPTHTELWFISFSCEECMRGSKRFVAKHFNELQGSKLINFDMVGNGIISIISAEPYFTTKHSMELAKEFQEATKEGDTTLPIRIVEFGGSDAAFFSKRKLDAIAVIGLTPQNYPSNWHEMRDTPENINEHCLNETLNAAIKYIGSIDSKFK